MKSTEEFNNMKSGFNINILNILILEKLLFTTVTKKIKEKLSLKKKSRLTTENYSIATQFSEAGKQEYTSIL